MSAVEKWVEKATYDLDTARAMQESGRYLYVIFCCQQAIEKSIKAIIAKQTGELPPRIHALMLLAEAAALELSDERSQLFRILSNYYLHSRYPEEIEEMNSRITGAQTQNILEQTEESMRWLLSMI